MSRSLIGRLLRPYWRLTRGITLGAQGLVIDGENRVLLIRHSYRRGWFFPGGGVEHHETAAEALARELFEEAGVEITGPAELHGLFANAASFPGDHIALFIVRAWRQARPFAPTAEIAAQGFFAPAALPDGTDAGTRRRLKEVFDGYRPVAERW